MDLDFFQFGELIDIKLEEGSHLIYSMSEPFSEEDIEARVMHSWLDHFKIQFHQVHASGRISKEQLVEMVGEINPKRVFSVHTENQQLFKKYCSNVRPKRKLKSISRIKAKLNRSASQVDDINLAEFANRSFTASTHFMQ